MSEAPSANPFEAPKTHVDRATLEIEHHGDASKSQRFAHLLIDYVVILIFSFMLGIALAIVRPTWLDGDDPILDRVFGTVLMLVFYLSFEGLTGRTPGKLVTRTKVVRAADGLPPTFGQVLGRSLARFVPFEPFSFLGRDDHGWHDRWSGTRVVRLRPHRQNSLSE